MQILVPQIQLCIKNGVIDMTSAARKLFGDEYLIGQGYELGAGLVPSMFAQVQGLTVIDKRDVEELAVLFGETPPYDVMTYESARTAPQKDFVTAHHVLEHCPDPIAALMQWIPLVRRAGTIFLSVPSCGNVCEAHREVTPMRHLLTDHLALANGEDFASRNHIPSFINQWTVLNLDYTWFAGRDVKFYAEQLLAAQRNVEGNDIHWHTFSLETLRGCLEVAAHLVKRAVGDVRLVETDDELFIAATVYAKQKQPPEVLLSFVNSTRSRLSDLIPSRWDQLFTRSSKVPE